MGRKRKKIFRYIFPDRIYNSIEVSKFINIITISGKKTISSNIVYKSFEYIKFNFKKDPLKVFSSAINNISPMLEMKSKKFGNFKSLIPVEISNHRRIILAMKWLKIFSLKRKERFIHIKLANEIIDSYNKKSLSFKKKIDLHRVLTSNKSYSFLNKKKKKKWN